MLLGLAALAGGGGLAGILAYPHVDTARLWYDVIGVDVSHHQGAIDWPTLARTDIAFVYIKATEGGDFRDRRFQATGALPPVVDLEHMGACRSGSQVANLVKEVATFLGMLEEHFGRRPILYTDVVFDATYLRGHFMRETFWTRSIVVPPWFRRDQWLIWQYHSCGRRAGVNGPVDLNAFRGSRRQLEAFAKGQAVRV